MTSPSGPSNFEYSDDSVVARLSFDVPPQALTDVSQLTQALSAMATQQEYISRSTGTWLDYMQQVPQIMERANQSYREAITQMERMSYIQGEMGGGPGPNVSPGATAGPTGGGYTTAAPAGYSNPFAGQFFGMGMTPDLTSAQQHMGMMASQDPRLYANMMAARGQAVNPAMMGAVGGAVAGATGQGGVGNTGGGQGWGNAAPGSQSPQATQTSRDSASPPDPTQSGQGKSSEQQNIPATPHPDAPAWQQAIAGGINSAQQVVNEAQASGGRNSKLLGMASAGLGGAASLMNKYASGDDMGKLGTVAKGIGAAGAVGGAAWMFNKGQDAGEMLQRYQQLGSVQGGDMGTGMQYEAQARLLALNPFITTQQARQAMQMALSSGFRGGDYDTIQDYMLSNFKDLGVQFSTSMDIAKQSIKSGETAGQATAGTRETLQSMYELSRTGGASFPERQEQFQNTFDSLTGMGVNAESARRASVGLQEGYGDNMALRDSIDKIGIQSAGSPTLMQLAAQKAGVTGVLPGALPAALAEKGIDPDEAMLSGAKQIAEFCKGYPERLNRIAAFQALMGQQGVQLDFQQAEAMYDKVTGEKSPTEQANENIDRASKTDNRPILSKAKSYLTGLGKYTGGALAAAGDVLGGHYSDAWHDLTQNPFSSEKDESKGTADLFAKGGRTPQEPPKTPQDVKPVQTEGQVSGQVTITVDQSGKVNAPSTIQLTGQQKSANAGWGNSTLNNPGPGDNHTSLGWDK